MKKAIVLLNTGDARNKDELEVFLRNVFNDKNLSKLQNETIRSMASSFMVLTKLNRTWENYEKIGGSSPLHDLTQNLIKKLEQHLPECFITPAMHYTSPFAQTAIARIEELGIEQIDLLPMYSHYSKSVIGSSVEDFLQKADNRFTINVVQPYYKNYTFNKAICDDIVKTLGKYNDFHLVFLAHGIPKKDIKDGDPYQKQIEEHVEILKENLLHYAVSIKSINLAYHSQISMGSSLKPSFDDLLKHFKNKKVILYPLSFTIDNIQTVYELDMKYKEIARNLGLKEFKVVPCLNDGDTFIQALKELV